MRGSFLAVQAKVLSGHTHCHLSGPLHCTGQVSEAKRHRLTPLVPRLDMLVRNSGKPSSPHTWRNSKLFFLLRFSYVWIVHNLHTVEFQNRTFFYEMFKR